MKNNIVISSILIVALNLVGLSAHAANDNYPASMCVQWNANLPTPVLNYSRIFNNSRARMYVDCPVIRKDFDGFLHNAAVESSWLSAIDRHANDAVCATLVKYRHTGFTSTATRASRGRQCTTINSSVTSPFAQKLQLGRLRLNHPDYHMYISVRVPGRIGTRGTSAVVTYNARQ